MGEARSFTFGSGVTVGVRPVSPLLRDRVEAAVRAARPKPEPPTVPVVWADGSEIQEDNITDPDYQDRLAAYENEVQRETQKHLTNLIILAALDIDPAVVADELAQLDAIAALVGAPPAVDLNIQGEPYPEAEAKKLRFVREVAISSIQDWSRLSRLLYRNAVDEEAIAAAASTFQG